MVTVSAQVEELLMYQHDYILSLMSLYTGCMYALQHHHHHVSGSVCVNLPHMRMIIHQQR